MNIHFILHEKFEVPGAYLKQAQKRGHHISSTKVYEEEELPETVDDIDFLIVMGGPQSPDEDRQVFPYYDPKAEIALIQKAIDADIYIVGYAQGLNFYLQLMVENMNIVQNVKLAFSL